MPHKKSPDGYLSVTEVLSLAINKPFLAFWRGKVGNEEAGRIQRESQELGIAVHELIEQQFRDGVTQFAVIGNKERMVNNFWKDFVLPFEVTAEDLEVTLQDPALKLQGTFDARISCIKGRYLADWKTSNQLDKVSVPLQLSAYDHLDANNTGKGLAVRIDKEKDKIQVVWYEDLKPYWPIFQDCMRVARYIKFGIEEEQRA